MSGHRRRLLNALLGMVVLLLLALAVGPWLLDYSERHPIEALIIGVGTVITVASVVLYMGELTVLGWVVDFVDELGIPKIDGPQPPLEYEQIGEIIVVTLRDNIVTAEQCREVQNQLMQLVEEHYCDFVLDFAYAGRISTSLRGVMRRLTKAAREEARRLGKPYRPLELPRGETFKVFHNRKHALRVMARHEGHGWLVLCSVPVGTRAVYELP